MKKDIYAVNSPVQDMLYAVLLLGFQLLCRSQCPALDPCKRVSNASGEKVKSERSRHASSSAQRPTDGVAVQVVYIEIANNKLS